LHRTSAGFPLISTKAQRLFKAVLQLLAAIGDDRLRLDAQGDRDACSMTRCWDRRHGTAQQKVRWFRRGLEPGDLSQGERIDATEL
jgi:predicted metalloprotease